MAASDLPVGYQMKSGSTKTPARLHGPERPTLVESFVRLLHISYLPGALVLALMFTGPGTLLGAFLDTFSLDRALSATLQKQTTYPVWQVIAAEILYTAFTLYELLIIRYVRLRVVAAEKELVSLLPKGKEDFARAFGRVSAWYGPIPLAGVMLLLFLSPVLQKLHSTTGPFHSLLYGAGSLAQFVLGGTMVWVYFASISGVYVIGRLPLRLKPHHADPMLGLRPFGALSLSLAFAYFGAVLSMSLEHLFNPLFAPGQHVALLLPLAVLGVLMFFLPLHRLHKHMQQVKRHEQALLRTRRARLAESLDHGESPSSSEKETLRDIRRMLAFMASSTMESRLAGMPTWPFDLGILARLVTILLAVATGLVVRLITVRLGL